MIFLLRIYALIKVYIPYLLVSMLCILFVSSYHTYLLYKQKKQDLLTLNNSSDSIGTKIINNFRVALEARDDNKNSLTLFKTHNNPSYTTDFRSHIDFIGDTICIVTPSRLLLFDKEKLTNLILTVLPEYASYNVIVNEFVIAKNMDFQKNILPVIIKEYRLNNNYKVTLKVAIKKDNPTYLAIIRKINLVAFSITVASLIVLNISLYFYLRQQRRLNFRIKNLENNLTGTTKRLEDKLEISERLKNSLLDKLQAELTLKRLFIRNATAVYLDNNIPNMSLEQKRANELSNFLFPIAFTEPANDEEIDLNKVIKDLTGYLAFEATKYDIKFDKQVDIIKVQCSSVVFYQILFSLVSNLILLMPPVSDTPALDEPKKKFIVTFLEEKVIIDFETFPLNAEQIAGFADKKIPIDAFFLDYKRVLESLKSHNIGYSVSPGKVSNRFELDFKKKTPKGKPNLRLVE